MASVLQTSLEYLPGVGPAKSALLSQELKLYTFEDLIQHYPFRYEDRTQLLAIGDINPQLTTPVQLRGTITHMRIVEGKKKRLVIRFKDNTGEINLLWFQGVQWMAKKLQAGIEYLVFGKLNSYGQHMSIVHPEIEVVTPQNTQEKTLRPVYHSTEKLKSKYLDSKGIAKLQQNLWEKAANTIVETLPTHLLQQYRLLGKQSALHAIHFPKDLNFLQKAQLRLKFEELFYVQLQLLQHKKIRTEKYPGYVFRDTKLLHQFYHHCLPFTLTGAQQRVVKEIYQDLHSGHQMNRLVQGDVGSGKTMVAFLSMLICIGSGAQVAMMAPTEILAEQHYKGLQVFAKAIGISMAFLTGSTPRKQRKEMLENLQAGTIQLLVGTHALLNTEVAFQQLGLAVIDEQHRFGVAQRAQLWTKNEKKFPHVLVMTATPIPRTLAMTLYGDLDVSVIDEMPAGRKPIKTVHYYDTQRLKAFGLLKQQLAVGRQVYIVYPLIEESEKLDYKNLMDGYESVSRAFPQTPVSIVHGKMNSADKEYEMQRFVQGETKIMVATTVIEVGVNVPNASVMVIENAERFGLAQLHQLRGRVGRGSEQSYCILMTDAKLGQNSRERIQTMVRTDNGFEIADVDLQLRGPGDLLGIHQSGVLDLKIADLSQDIQILQTARTAALDLLQEDPTLEQPAHLPVKKALQHIHRHAVNWGDIS